MEIETNNILLTYTDSEQNDSEQTNSNWIFIDKNDLDGNTFLIQTKSVK